METANDILQKFNLDELDYLQTFPQRQLVKTWMQELKAKESSVPLTVMAEVYNSLSKKMLDKEYMEQDRQCFEDAYEASNFALIFAREASRLDPDYTVDLVSCLISYARWGVMFANGGSALHDEAIQIAEKKYDKTQDDEWAIIVAQTHFEKARRCKDGTYDFATLHIKPEYQSAIDWLDKLKNPNTEQASMKEEMMNFIKEEMPI